MEGDRKYGGRCHREKKSTEWGKGEHIEGYIIVYEERLPVFARFIVCEGLSHVITVRFNNILQDIIVYMLQLKKLRLRNWDKG